jgi:hypothetical protein
VVGLQKGQRAVIDFYCSRLSACTATKHEAHTLFFDFDSDDQARGVVSAHTKLSIAGKIFPISLL